MGATPLVRDEQLVVLVPTCHLLLVRPVRGDCILALAFLSAHDALVRKQG